MAFRTNNTTRVSSLPVRILNITQLGSRLIQIQNLMNVATADRRGNCAHGSDATATPEPLLCLGRRRAVGSRHVRQDMELARLATA